MSDISVLLQEDRSFPPTAAFRDAAHVGDDTLHASAAADPEAFWAAEAATLQWDRPWDQVLEWTPPHAKWFTGGKLNACVNCVDRHIAGPRRNKAAIIWEGEPGDRRTMTYWDLYREVNLAANMLKHLGVQKGDRVAIYLPMIPEAIVAMLACARIGAVHSVVFGGFAPEALRDRINDAGAKVLITADGGSRRGQTVPLKRNADKAIAECPSIEHVLVVMRRRTGVGDETFADMKDGRDHWWHRLKKQVPKYCEPELMDAEDLLFILYTSGTTGKPKGIVHTTGGYLTGVASTTRLVFDLKEDDVFWCTADIGWITGHSYLVYGPLANGATCVVYEGAPDWPRHDLLHRAHRDSRVHEVGRGPREALRPLAPSPARLRGRADQPGGVDVVSGAHRPGALPDRGHVVADRDGRHHDFAAPRRDGHQAGLRDHAVPRHQHGPARRARRGEAERRRAARDHEAVAQHAAHHLG